MAYPERGWFRPQSGGRGCASSEFCSAKCLEQVGVRFERERLDHGDLAVSVEARKQLVRNLGWGGGRARKIRMAFVPRLWNSRQREWRFAVGGWPRRTYMW